MSPTTIAARLLAVLVILQSMITVIGGATANATIADPTQTNYDLGVLVLKYIPTADGVNIDTSVTGDVSGTVAEMRSKTDQVTANLEHYLSVGTAYRQYANSAATPSLTYHVVNTLELDTAAPTVPNPNYDPPGNPYKVRPDYNQIMTNAGICDYVQNRGVNEV